MRAILLAFLVAGPAAAQSFDPVYEAFSHPRCANCHVENDVPLWSVDGEIVPHGMAIRAGESRMGIETLPCETCHRAQNAPVQGGAPGAEGWALPPPEMAWSGRTATEICEQIKDPERNGGRTLAEVADHIVHDPLVVWGWAPGEGRAPAPDTPQALADAILAWEAAGAPCP
ncbi:hypothetical protein [Jannaschia aquimarina]|uniref:Cytochrome c domain-containing protein n=1 Tax=Jannaschia aquimarina TaxID=935700 RepID=A0A0D1EFQ1_9RHOB|nr:hypothetical protein [Jannaschia aquimarina]KIT16504.1 hypothetical protein jaqu_17320 [Jannaschia aquimarina]SNT06984.1 hypothetical protein SAMN05421775_105113 [Jannaschia aquimarina]